MGCGASKKYKESPAVALNDLDDAPNAPPASSADKENAGPDQRETNKYKAENVPQDLKVIEGDAQTSQNTLRERNDQMPASADGRVPDAQELLHKYAQQEAAGRKPKKVSNSHIFAPSSAPLSNDVVRCAHIQPGRASQNRSPADDHEVLANNQVGGMQLKPKLK